MGIGRRELLVGTASLGLTGVVGAFRLADHPTTTAGRWHQRTESLLDRAKRAGSRVDRSRVERIVHEVAGGHGRPVIKWVESPARAFEHLLRYSLDELAQMPTAQLWPYPSPTISAGEDDAEERWIELHSQVNEALKVDEHGLALIGPKLDFRARAIASGSRPERVVEARVIAAEVGWIETSLPGAAAGAILAVEDLLLAGHDESSMEINHQLRAFDAFEHGLLATWETPDAIICLPRLT